MNTPNINTKQVVCSESKTGELTDCQGNIPVYFKQTEDEAWTLLSSSREWEQQEE